MCGVCFVKQCYVRRWMIKEGQLGGWAFDLVDMAL